MKGSVLLLIIFTCYRNLKRAVRPTGDVHLGQSVKARRRWLTFLAGMRASDGDDCSEGGWAVSTAVEEGRRAESREGREGGEKEVSEVKLEILCSALDERAAESE